MKIPKFIHNCFAMHVEQEVELAKLIYDLYDIDIHHHDDALFKSICKYTQNNQINILQWLCSISNIYDFTYSETDQCITNYMVNDIVYENIKL